MEIEDLHDSLIPYWKTMRRLSPQTVYSEQITSNLDLSAPNAVPLRGNLNIQIRGGWLVFK